MSFFKIVGEVVDVEVIARGNEIRQLRRLRRVYGGRMAKTEGCCEN